MKMNAMKIVGFLVVLLAVSLPVVSLIMLIMSIIIVDFEATVMIHPYTLYL